jgi:hypothetical protein
VAHSVVDKAEVPPYPCDAKPVTCLLSNLLCCRQVSFGAFQMLQFHLQEAKLAQQDGMETKESLLVRGLVRAAQQCQAGLQS